MRVTKTKSNRYKHSSQSGFVPILLLALGGALLLVAGSALYLYQGGSAGPVAQVPPAPKAPGDSAQQQSDTRFYGADPVDSLARSNANIQGLSETQVRDLIRQALGQQRAAAGPRGEAGLPGQPGAPGPAGSEGPRGHGGGASVSNGSGLPSGAGANALLYDDGTTQDWSGSPTILGLTLDSLQADTAGDLVTGMVTTEAVSGLDGSSYSSTQKWVAMGDDDLVRFVYFANNGRDLHFVQCLDEDCATISDELVVSNSHNTDEPALYVGTDGFARISYVTYDTPNELHHVRCTNASCSAKVDTLVDTSDSVGKTAYSHTSIAMGVDGFARIVYDNYDATSALRLATCNDADCTAPTLTTVVASGNYLETSSVAVGDDGYARIVYVDSSPNPKELHFIQCTNAGCTTRNNGTLASSVILYYVDIVMGLDGYARLTYPDGATGQLKFIQCTNDACSANVITTVATDAYWNVSLALGDDGFARISHSGEDDPYPLSFILCTNAACTTRNSKLVSSTSFSTNGLVTGSDGLARIVYLGYDIDTFVLSRFNSDDGEDEVIGSSIGTSGTKFGQVYGYQFNADELYVSDSVGIGTTAPTAELEVSGSVNVTDGVISVSNSDGDWGSDDYATLEVNTDVTNPTVRSLYITSPSNGDRIYFGKAGKSVYSVNFGYVANIENAPPILGRDGMRFGAEPDSGLNIGRVGGNVIYNASAPGAGNHLWYGSSAGFTGYLVSPELMRLTPSGNLGIGTNNPTEMLTVNGGNVLVDGLNSALLALDKNGVGDEATINFKQGGTTYGSVSYNTSGAFAMVGGNSLTTRVSAGNSGTLELSTGASGIITVNNGASEFMRVSTAGYVGIGSTSPEALLEVQGIEATDAVIALDADDGDDSADTWFIKSVASDNSLSILNHTTSVFTLSSAGNLNIAGNCSDAAGGGGCTADYAEVYEAADKSQLEPGDLLALGDEGKLVRASSENDSIIGVYSTSPGLLIGGDGINIGSGEGTEGLLEGNDVPVALAGRVPVKFSGENGKAGPGDRLAMSQTEPGRVMRMGESGQSVGIALEAPQDGMVLVFINLTYHKLDISQGESGQIIAVTGDQDMAGFSLLNVSAISSVSGNWQIDGNGFLQAKQVNTDKLCIGTTCVDEETLKELLDNRQQPPEETPVSPEPEPEEANEPDQGNIPVGEESLSEPVPEEDISMPIQDQAELSIEDPAIENPGPDAIEQTTP